MRKETKDKIKLAKINEAYHRKKMEYYLEDIKILNDCIKYANKPEDNEFDKVMEELNSLFKNIPNDNKKRKLSKHPKTT